jgi:probable rRNA maturation factor
MPVVTRPEEKEIGEIFISVPYVQRWCTANNSAVDTRLTELICHGICHCLGYDHETDSDFRVMRRKELSLLRKLALLQDGPVQSSRKEIG